MLIWLGVLASRVNSDAAPTRFHEIFQIVKSEIGDRERILRLQREGDKGLVFHGLFSEEPEGGDYVNVGVAYNSAASICDKIEEPIGEIFSYLDQNLELCINLFQLFLKKIYII